MTPAEFARKWRANLRTERAASHEHFMNLCEMLGQPTPNEDPTGEAYAFEKGASKSAGGEGWADVWKKGFFAWEYKGRKKNLRAAYLQLEGYREALDNPPLLVVSDLNVIEIHTNFTNTKAETFSFDLDDLARHPAEPLRLLRALFSDPFALSPHTSPEVLTERAAERFAALASALRDRGHDPVKVAHFLDRLVFCFFAEDAGLLPAGLIGRLAETTRGRPAEFAASLADLFGTMAHGGGMFGTERIDWFDGGLFEDAEALELTPDEIGGLIVVGRLDWAFIEPAIFGTLFERGLDPAQRAQLGAHYTSRDDIERLVEPVVMRPLRREYAAMQARVAELTLSGRPITEETKPADDPVAVFRSFLHRLRSVRVLDPACGSGNFLYIALTELKDLEYEAVFWGSQVLPGVAEQPVIGPEAVMGLEINGYAAELARVTIWIGYLQWQIRHGIDRGEPPILRPLDTIRTMDALLDLADPTHPREAEWPAAEFIVGNPPFLGRKFLRSQLGDLYVDQLYALFAGRVSHEADLCCYWHDQARAQIAASGARRAGLLATQNIRGGPNRRVLERIYESGSIFFALSDEPWVLAGANVHISFVGQDDGSETDRELDGQPVASINANLTAGVDLTRARRLPENLGIAFMGDTMGGPFDIDAATAAAMLRAPNPDGRSNAEVIRPAVNGLDLTRRPRDRWIVDFGIGMTREEAALYEAPFEYVARTVKPERDTSRSTTEQWWQHERPRGDMRSALRILSRYIATPTTSKHRLFRWLSADVLPSVALIAIARDDDFTFGVLQSSIHEKWALAIGTQLETRPRYTPNPAFETFPFPRPTDEQRAAIGAAAARLNELREGWLNPPGLPDAELAKRTLTNLYNARPTWLANAHATLDAAVLDAYGWSADLPDAEILERLLDLNLERAA